MRPSLRLRAGAAAGAGLLAVAAGGFLAAPAGAHAPGITISRPGDGERLTSATFSVDARVTTSRPSATAPVDVIAGDITVRVEPLNLVEGSEQPAITQARPGGEAPRDVSVTFGVDYNGRYRATVSASSENRGIVGSHPPQQASAIREFFVVAPPRPPTNVRAAIDPATRAVTISWAANPEKDLLGYIVQRARPGGEFEALGSTGSTSVTDPSTAQAGGEYRYQVIAVRRGEVPSDDKKGVSSDPTTVKAGVPDPPATTDTTAGGSTGTTTPGEPGSPTTAGGGSGGSNGGRPAPTISPSSPGALTKSGTIDLSGFSAIQSQARRSAPRPVVPDPGFDRVLPFSNESPDTTRTVDGESAAGEAEEEGGDEPAVGELGVQEASEERRRSLGFLAGGLLATVVLMHLLWVRGEVHREPLEAITPE